MTTTTTPPSPARYTELLAAKAIPANRRDRHRHRAGTIPGACSRCRRLAEDELTGEALHALDRLRFDFEALAASALPTLSAREVARRLAG